MLTRIFAQSAEAAALRIANLPRSHLLHVMSFLLPREHYAARTVCKAWQASSLLSLSRPASDARVVTAALLTDEQSEQLDEEKADEQALREFLLEPDFPFDQNYKVEQHLGEGGCALVLHVTEIASGSQFAAKLVRFLLSSSLTSVLSTGIQKGADACD